MTDDTRARAAAERVDLECTGADDHDMVTSRTVCRKCERIRGEIAEVVADAVAQASETECDECHQRVAVRCRHCYNEHCEQDVAQAVKERDEEWEQVARAADQQEEEIARLRAALKEISIAPCLTALLGEGECENTCPGCRAREALRAAGEDLVPRADVQAAVAAERERCATLIAEAGCICQYQGEDAPECPHVIAEALRREPTA